MRLLLWPQFDPKTAILHLLGWGGGAAAISFIVKFIKTKMKPLAMCKRIKKTSTKIMIF